MKLLDSINAACDVISLDRFDTVVGNGDPNAQTMIEFAQEAGEEIARRVDWNRTLATASITETPFTLPEDFQRLISGGSIICGGGAFARSVFNGGEWAVIKSVPSIQPFFFIKGGRIEFAPALAADGAIINYVSKNWLMSGAEAISQISADDNTPLFAGRLLTKGIIWRWRRQKGLAYDDQLAEFEADLAFEISADRGSSQ